MASEIYEPYIQNRIELWDKYVAAKQINVDSVKKPIKITLKDGKQLDAEAFVTTPIEICKLISNSLAKNVIVAKVNDKLWDLTRPFEEDSVVEFFDFESNVGSHTFWHSSAHILGQAIELEFKNANLCIGPPLEDGGFYYDVHLPPGQTITPADYERIQKRIDNIIKQKQNFSRIVLTKSEALELFSTNPFKQEIISKKIADDDVTTAYKCGPLIDLCRGPHVLNTGKIHSMIITKNSSSYWNADANNAQLQRVYGISFPNKQLLDEYKLFLKQAEERDHRRIGIAQELFFFHQLSPGSAFFLPHGARLYNTLQNYIRDQYRKRGYGEVVTPNVYNIDLWKQSGHYQNYRENMFSFTCENQEFAMKPMNCPGHCLMFAHRLRSYRELPIRMADFGVLHRNEISGALSGLTRVRRFQQDDAHIFCRPDQIEQEVAGVLDMLQEVYGHFGFKFNLMLSTRPENYLGEISLWDNAEKALTNCLNAFCDKFGHTWGLNPGDGAFYGPKIDIQLTDAMKRKHQCGTCQLDFQLPIRFGLQYRTKENNEIEENNNKKSETSAPSEESNKKKGPLTAEEKAARAAAHRAANEKKRAEEEANKNNKVEQVKVETVKSTPEDEHQCCHSNAVKEYVWKEEPLTPGYERPVMIHRAILGSIERMIAVLIEHTGGKWPFWLNPRQVIVVPISEHFLEYAYEVRDIIHNAGFFVDVADSNKQFNKKIAEAAVEGYNYILVVGEKEKESRSVNVRFRDEKKQESQSIEDVIKLFNQVRDSKL